MARSLAKRDVTRKESAFPEHFETAELLTLGAIYEKNARFGGGAYNSFLKKVDRFSDKTLTASLRERADLAARLLACSRSMSGSGGSSLRCRSAA